MSSLAKWSSLCNGERGKSCDEVKDDNEGDEKFELLCLVSSPRTSFSNSFTLKR